MSSNSDSLLSGINTPFFGEGAKVLNLLYQFSVADQRTEDLLKTIRHITLNVENVRRLRRLDAGRLSARDLNWVDALISDTEDAIGGLATLVERARVDKETKERISWWNKGCWVAYYGPKVKEKHLKLTVCHQSLLSVFPFLFKDHGGLASVLEETTENDQRPYDLNMTKWLGWQDQRQRRRSTLSLRQPTSPQRPMSVSSGVTDITSASTGSSNSSTSMRPLSSEASSQTGSHIGIPYHPAASSQYCSLTSANVIPKSHEVPSTISIEKNPSGSRESLQSRGSPDLVTDSLGLTYPVFHNKFEDNYDPPSALPGDSTDSGIDNLAPSTKYSNIHDGADGLQVWVPPDGSGVLPDWVHQLQISPPGSQTAASSQIISTKRSSDSTVDLAEAMRCGRAFAMPLRTPGVDRSKDTEQKATPGSFLQFSDYLPPFEFERPISQDTTSFAGQFPEIQSLNASEDGAEPSLEGKKPPIDRAYSDTYAPMYSISSRPGLSPSGKVAAASGGRSLSGGQRGARRGGRSWIAFHSSRSDLNQGDGWGEG